MSPAQVIDLPESNGRSYIVQDGQRYHRINCDLAEIGGLSDVRLLAGEYDMNAYPKVSSTLPQWCPGAEHVTDRSSRHYGKAIIRSATHQRELCKQHQFTRSYDPH